MNIFLLLVGLVLVLAGANALTDGAASIAKRFHLSDLVIGLTVVAFGTSAPELTVSLSSALKGSADMAVGNVVGSNLFNTLLIVGCTSLIAPIVITRNTLLKEIPLCILAALALLFMGNDTLLDEAAGNQLGRTDGLVLLLFMGIFTSYTFAIAHNNNEDDDNNTPAASKMPLWKAALFVVGGLAALVYGGDLFVGNATDLARSWGVSESVIGLTLLAGGTSLPELATSAVAALKGNADMAVGNVVGSNLFNIFMVLGASATATPLSLGGIDNLDLLALVGACVLLWLFGVFFKKRTITRIEGSVLTLAYVAYIAVRLIGL